MHDSAVYVRPKVIPSDRERPFGMTDRQPWPFRDTPHAKPPRDGKAKARTMEDLHCAVLDIEEGLRHMHPQDVDLLMKYHILQTHTLDELVAECKLASKGSMQQRLFRIVQRLTREMEHHGSQRRSAQIPQEM
jgi:hypothetical protein